MSTAPLPEPAWRFDVVGLPEKSWTVVAVHATDTLADLYSATLVLAMEVGGASLDGLVGERALLRTHRGDAEHRLHGVVRCVEDLGTLASWRFAVAEVVPSLWLLSQRSDVRIFQERSVIDVIRAVLRDAGIYQGPDALQVDPSLAGMTPREYLVQHAESDLAFVRRLLEDEGLPFRFDQARDGGEALVLAGDDHAWPAVPTLDGGPSRILDDGLATEASESVGWFDERHEVRTTSVTVRDYDFSRPRASLDMTARHGAPAARLARYEYPARASIARYDGASQTYRAHDAVRLARVRTEEHLCRVHQGRGRSNLTGMTAGSVLALTGHERAGLDAAYLVTEVVHAGSAWHALPASLRASPRLRSMLEEAGVAAPTPEEGARYENRFRTHRMAHSESSVPFRPARVTPRPVVEGPQTARVVGPAGEDVHTDAHGRIKVQFHWDRVGQEDENSSCWVRLAQSWGGGGWGFTVIPRVGMEVIVDFLEGDPDRPLVMGCVYNGENQHATALPETKTQSALRSSSTPHTGGYNEIRLEDRAGGERFYVQAERDHETLVKHDQTITVQRHRTKLVQGEEYNTVEQNRVTQVKQDNVRRVDGNQEVEVHGAQGAALAVDNHHDIVVGGDQTVTVGKSQTERVGENRSLTVGKNLTEMIGGSQAVTVGKDLAESIGGGQEVTVSKALALTVGGARTEKVGGAMSLSVGKALSETVGGDLSVTVNGLAGASFKIAQSFNVSAKFGITLACGDSKIEISPDEIKITSKTVRIKGEKLTDIKGGLVKINCPDPEADKKKEAKKSPIEDLKKSITDGLDKVLAALPAPLRDAIKKAVTSAIDETVKALASDKMPDFKKIGQDALTTVAGGALRSANDLVTRGFKGLLDQDFIKNNPALKGLVEQGQERVKHGMEEALHAAQTFGAKLAATPEGAGLHAEHPAVVHDLLHAVGAPVMGAAAAELEVPAEGGPEGAHVLGAIAQIGQDGWREACRVVAGAEVPR